MSHEIHNVTMVEAVNLALMSEMQKTKPLSYWEKTLVLTAVSSGPR